MQNGPCTREIKNTRTHKIMSSTQRAQWINHKQKVKFGCFFRHFSNKLVTPFASSTWLLKTKLQKHKYTMLRELGLSDSRILVKKKRQKNFWASACSNTDLWQTDIFHISNRKTQFSHSNRLFSFTLCDDLWVSVSPTQGCQNCLE